MLKLLHTADWHLGRRFRSFTPEQELKLTRARLDVLDRIFLAAERFAVDAVLCAGDLFDEPCPDPEWWEQVAARLQKRKWRDRPVFLLPGNHDPLVPESVWAKDHKFRSLLPEWVHVVDRETVRVRAPEQRGSLRRAMRLKGRSARPYGVHSETCSGRRSDPDRDGTRQHLRREGLANELSHRGRCCSLPWPRLPGDWRHARLPLRSTGQDASSDDLSRARRSRPRSTRETRVRWPSSLINRQRLRDGRYRSESPNGHGKRRWSRLSMT